MFGLSPLETHCLIWCFHEGFTAAEVAHSINRSTHAVNDAIKRACDKIVAQGLPRPKPYGRGSRAELMAWFPRVNWDTRDGLNDAEFYTPGRSDAGVQEAPVRKPRRKTRPTRA